MQKLEHVTTIEAVSVMNQDLMARTTHATDLTEPGCRFIRSIEFGASRDDAKQLFVGRKVKITVELMPDDEPLR